MNVKMFSFLKTKQKTVEKNIDIYKADSQVTLVEEGNGYTIIVLKNQFIIFYTLVPSVYTVSIQTILFIFLKLQQNKIFPWF